MSFITPEMIIAVFAGIGLLVTVIFHERRQSNKQPNNPKQS